MHPVEHIRISSKARDQLVTLKRHTGIKNWNVLCRWAFCVSLAEATPPAPIKIVADSTVEMSWRVFGGAHHDIYAAILRERCRRDGLPLDADTLAEQFRLHLHRGISYLAGEREHRSIKSLLLRGLEVHSTGTSS